MNTVMEVSFIDVLVGFALSLMVVGASYVYSLRHERGVLMFFGILVVVALVLVSCWVALKT